MVKIREAVNLKLLGQWLQDGGIGILAGDIVAYASNPNISWIWYFILIGIVFLAVGGILSVSSEEKP